MNLKKREKTILLITLSVLGLLLFDRVVLTPVLNYHAQVMDEHQNLTDQIQRAQRTFAKSKLMTSKWQLMQQQGLTTNLSAAEGKALHAVRSWAQDSNLDLATLKPELVRGETTLPEIDIQVTANGNMQQVARFLYLAETSILPVRVKDIQLGSRENATNDLTLAVRLSVLYLDQSADQALALKGLR